ncbi:hypothetical protein THAR02_02571 [Trichoderma harzianum]|uniref:Uncharacterized protein n=1 Tax=Trichoderma harzianum TaxID=5544 RepID=A0A0F9XLC1_TRIHA|nr:hypothetical protein THAR02_02571 [Trichoderma harzianum]
MGKLYYFQAPNLNINPCSDVAPRLGSIFSNLETLTAPLNQHEYINVPKYLMNQNLSTDFHESESQSFTAKANLGSNIIQGIEGPADLVYAFARDKNNIYSCEFLETLEFEPNQEFVAECILASQRVQSFLENSLIGRRRVYMITGLKIASGLTKSSAEKNQHNSKLTVAAKPIAIGDLGLNMTATNAQTVSCGRTLNKTVFAYRAIRIKLKWDGQVRYRYKSGGKYSVDDASDDEDEDRWELQPLDGENRLKDFPDSIKINIEGRVVDEE